MLRVSDILAQTNNKGCKWWGFYKVQKDMYVNSEAVFSSMITSGEWDLIMEYTEYGSATRGTDTYTTKPDLSGSAYATDSTKYDISKNIYDLAGNVSEYTLTSAGVISGDDRIAIRGGHHGSSSTPANRNGSNTPDNALGKGSNLQNGTRAVIYIK